MFANTGKRNASQRCLQARSTSPQTLSNPLSGPKTFLCRHLRSLHQRRHARPRNPGCPLPANPNPIFPFSNASHRLKTTSNYRSQRETLSEQFWTLLARDGSPEARPNRRDIESPVSATSTLGRLSAPTRSPSQDHRAVYLRSTYPQGSSRGSSCRTAVRQTGHPNTTLQLAFCTTGTRSTYPILSFGNP